MTTLAAAAQAVGLDFGFAFTGDKIATYPTTADMIADQSSILTDAGFQLISTLQPSQGVFNFTPADSLVSWGQSNNLRMVQGGHLIYGSFLPSWVTAITNATTLRSVLETHVQTVISHFGASVRHWNVTNEVIAVPNGNPGGYRTSHWYTTLGDQFIKYAFDAAAAVASTDTKLIWNDYNFENTSSTHFEATLVQLERWLDDGVRIDGVGSQMHMNPPSVCSPAELVDRYGQMTDLGLDICITELDVYDTAYTGTAEEIKQQCADLVLSMLSEVCRDVDRLTHVICWGATDEISWLNDSLGPRGDGIPRTGNPYDRSDPPLPNPMRQALIDAFGERAPAFDTTGNVANALINDRATITVATPSTAIEVRFGTDMLTDQNGLPLTGLASLTDETSATLNDESSLALLDNGAVALAGQTTTGSESVTLTLTGGT
jgi:GH35 family endo-1,4-beta-xylanase